MSRTKINIEALRGALDAAREARSLSWRQLAKDMEVTPSLLSRVNNGYRPDADGFATIVQWLNMPAEMFMLDEDSKDRNERPEVDLVTQMAPLLRARQDLKPDDVRYIEEVMQATMRLVNARKRSDE